MKNLEDKDILFTLYVVHGQSHILFWLFGHGESRGRGGERSERKKREHGRKEKNKTELILTTFQFSVE
jgi:hypothetical protein